MVQVPELDMTVSGRDEVGAVIGEGDGSHLTGHLVGGHHHVFLPNIITSTWLIFLLIFPVKVLKLVQMLSSSALSQESDFHFEVIQHSEKWRKSSVFPKQTLRLPSSSTR